MKKLYNEFLRVSKHEKISEKVMVTRVAVAVTIVIMCITAMSFSAYAYFSHSVTSATNVIKAANFEAKVQLQITDANGENVEVITNDDTSQTANLKANTEYFVTLEHKDTSTAKTGFVIITADKCDSKYHTQQLGRDGEGNTEKITFWLKPNADTKVIFRSHWGTSSNYHGFVKYGENDETYIINEEHITLSISQETNNNLLSDNTEDITESASTDTSSITENTTQSEQTTSVEQDESGEPTVEEEQSSAADATDIPEESDTSITESADESTENE